MSTDSKIIKERNDRKKVSKSISATDYSDLVLQAQWEMDWLSNEKTLASYVPPYLNNYS